MNKYGYTEYVYYDMHVDFVLFGILETKGQKMEKMKVRYRFYKLNIFE